MPARAERRKWRRHPADPQTVCDLLIDGAVECRALAVCNLSQGGARLRVGRRVAPGDTLRLFLHHEGRRVSCIGPARVLYAVGEPGGAYVVGLAFHRELSAAEVAGLKGSMPLPAGQGAAAAYQVQ
jgi:hypothetical protein